nr:MAG TPA: hypothetical protein [Caudoviricetes sp.]
MNYNLKILRNYTLLSKQLLVFYILIRVNKG